MEKELNLIQQLQQTPKWKEFSRWFVEKNYPCTTLKDDHVTGCHEWFVQLHPDFQKGVFEKFIEDRGYNIEKQLWDIPIEERNEMSEDEILEKRYKEAWFIRTVGIIYKQYTPICINPTDHYLGKVIPFDSFEQLLIWYFNN